MAKLNKGLLLGGISGRLGNLIYYNRKGKQCVRTLPRKSSRKTTKAQIIQRERFGVATRFLRPFTPLINLGFQHPKGRMTPYNYALSYIFKNALTGKYPDFMVDFSKMLFTHGTLTRAYTPNVKSLHHEIICFTWRDTGWSNNRGRDRVVLIAVSEDAAVCFLDANGKRAADSVYTGELTVTL